MDDLALDRELDLKADEALRRMDGDVAGAANLLVRWVQQGIAAYGIEERLLKDYVTALIEERSRRLA